MSADSENEAARARSHVEELKEISDGLGGFLLDELADLSTDRISEDAYQLLKFHGSYQQDNRDERAAISKAGRAFWPGRRPYTFPIASIVTSCKPRLRICSATYVPRAPSSKVGAGIC